MEPITTTRNVEKQNRKIQKDWKGDLWGDVEQHGRENGPTGVDDGGGEHDYDEDDDNEDV